jgi:hypothetical protein
MGGTGLATASSARPPLPLCPSSEHRARAGVSPYAHSRHLRSTGSPSSRLLHLYSLYIDLYTLHCSNIPFVLL